MENCLEAVSDKNCKLLVLCSLPSILSLSKQQYYGNPQNRFWYYLFTAFGEPFTEDYEFRKAIALKHHIAIWDVVRCANRKGSADSAIKNAQVNDIPAFLAKYPAVKKILFNGSFAYQTYVKFFGTPPLPFIQLLSTSPACAGRDSEKIAAWKKALTCSE